MRPAQRQLARALRPQTQHRAQMLQATVVVPFVVGAAGAHVDTFNRPDGPLGFTDDGAPWLVSAAPAIGVRGLAAALLDSGQDSTHPVGGVPAGASLTTAVVGGTVQITLLNSPGAGGNVRLGVGGDGSLVGLSGGVNGVLRSWYIAGNHSLPFNDPTPTAGDVLRIVHGGSGPGATISYYVNEVLLAQDPAQVTVGTPAAFQLNCGFGAASSFGSVLARFGEFSYTPPGAAATDVEVDFGDGVPVPCPRGSTCPPLVVGDRVLVLRQDHSNVVVDLITPLGAGA